MVTASFEDLRQSDEWAEYLSHLGWLTVRLKIKNQRSKIFIKELPLIGSIIKIQRPLAIPPVEKINEIAKKHRALFVKLEPSFAKASEGLRPFTPDNWPLLSSKTIWVDLTPNEEEIFARFSKDARYSIRRSQRFGVEVQSAKDLESFYNLFRETGRRKSFWVPPFTDLSAKVNAFKDNAALILAQQNSKIIAGALILFHDAVAYYHHAASSLGGRRVLAPYLIVWEAIRLSKERGCHTFDLEGIYDPRYKMYRRWKNISIFKKKFGGEEIEYPGSFIRYYNPIVKILFDLARRFPHL